MLICPECATDFTVELKIGIGLVLECPECSTPLEVVDVNPAVLEVAEEEAEETPLETEAALADEEDWLQ